MNIKIRSEQIKDYRRIAEINALAFEGEYVGEVTMVDSLRHGTMFDQELSLVAEVEGKVMGHVLFYPFDMYLNGKITKTVCLGPIAVDPEFQKSGVGGNLIEEGHKILKEKGYKLSFLFGHPSYYPRFGYIMNMFGKSNIKFEIDNMKQIEMASDEIKERTVKPSDLKELMGIWENWYGDIDLAIRPGEGLMDWISHTSDIKASVFLKSQEIIGFVRYNKNNLNDIRMFIAKNKEATMEILKYLKNSTSMKSIELPVHPDSTAINFFEDLEYMVDLQTWDAGMIKILDENDKDVEIYCREVQEGIRKAGLIVYPPSYDMA
ncbi:GNAT family N-acetyltransferase [Oceanirhabdus seepicola]|uniref:GNAT family N-acetyltransferase n=1 Tax=Oceanirhabdus seepicola TaxID=2828781 RepID=A0A9J6P627_9CLOT|nr:GNAT family N-acetyltransferase [Oceanirhabdus seepicola]MCM1992175.1 GNAT family N-acetyltransferase [Oceanirhabdus seepicola]